MKENKRMNRTFKEVLTEEEKKAFKTVIKILKEE